MQYTKEISSLNSYDLIVCGGGTAGFAAAVSAARQGLKTAIIEKMGCLDGNATSAGINHFLARRKYYEDTKEIVRKVRGIFNYSENKM